MSDIRKAVIHFKGVWPDRFMSQLIAYADSAMILSNNFKDNDNVICTQEQFEADAALWRKENEVKYKFEPVKDLSIGDFFKAVLDREKFYIHKDLIKFNAIVGEIQSSAHTQAMLFRELQSGKICRRIKCHWTENLPQKCVVWDDGEKSFSISSVDRIMGGISVRYFDIQDYAYQNALPITGMETIAEIEAMITEAGE